MFRIIFASGAAIFIRGVSLTQRNLVILALSIGVGLGAELRPEALVAFPESVRNFLAAGLLTGGLAAFVLNAALPERRIRGTAPRDD